MYWSHGIRNGDEDLGVIRVHLVFEALGEIELIQGMRRTVFLKEEGRIAESTKGRLQTLRSASQHHRGGEGSMYTLKKLPGTSLICLPLPGDVDTDTVLKVLQEILMYTQD